MADYTYVGLTAYIELSEKSVEGLNVLAEAIDAIRPFVDIAQFDEMDYKHILHSPELQYLYDNDHICYTDPSELPLQTPDAYQRATIDSVNIKGAPMLRLYVPAVAKDDDKVRHFMRHALTNVLSELFQEYLLCVKVKEGIEYERFEDLKETVLVSASRHVESVA
ncbi:hypothetical protein [Metabacillus sp. SLBN-84]